MSPRPRSRRRTLAFAALLAATTVAVSGTATAASAPGHSKLVRTDPQAGTPNVLDGEVDAILDVGGKILLGGTFTSVSEAGSTQVLSRPYLLAFDKDTGVVDPSFAPVLDGAVEALAAGPTAGTAYIGGAFNTVNGAAQKGIALLDTADGTQAGSFRPPYLNGIVYDIVPIGGHVVIGGTFTKVGKFDRNGLASLSEGNGKPDRSSPRR